MNSVFQLLFKEIGLKNRYMLLDVGAMGGIESKWSQLRKHIQVVAFEPNTNEYEKLVSLSGVKYLNLALNKSIETVVLNVTRHPACSSFFEPNMEVLCDFEDAKRYEVVEKLTLLAQKVTTLDRLFKDEYISDIDFIKIDTQGSELSILQGGVDRALSRLLGLQIEVEFIRLYKGQPLFGDVDRFLESKGFELIDLRRAYWKQKSYYDYVGKGQLVFGDALYLKTFPALCSDISFQKDREAGRAKIYKMVVTCLVYKFFDRAVRALDLSVELGLISANERLKVLKAIKVYAGSGLPFFWGRGFLAKAFFRLSEELMPKSYLGWADGDKNLGNVRSF